MQRIAEWASDHGASRMDACIHWVGCVLCVTRDGKRAERGQASSRPTWMGRLRRFPIADDRHGALWGEEGGGLERAKKGRTEGGRVWRAWHGVARDGRSASGRCGADWERLRAAVRAGEGVFAGWQASARRGRVAVRVGWALGAPRESEKGRRRGQLDGLRFVDAPLWAI